MDVFKNYFDTGYGAKPRKRKPRPAAVLKPKTAKVRAPAKRATTKPRPAPRRLPVVTGVAEKLAAEDANGSCLRSPCGVDRDPQLSKVEIAEAYAFVKKRAGHKEQVSLPQESAYLTVAFGGGVDSSAILVGLDQLWRETRDPRWVPLAVTFADVGSESLKTYQWIRMINGWLKTKAFRGAPRRPQGVIKIGHATMQRPQGASKPGWGTARTLEIHALINHSLPSISFGGHSCSTKWKIDAQRFWFEHALETGLLPGPGADQRIYRAIGYDATEARRRDRPSTYVATDEERPVSGRGKPRIFRAWYPLMEWGWDRARCAAEIANVFGHAPPKSSCTMCGAMKPAEVRALAEESPEQLARAVFMELVFLRGRHATDRPKLGLNQQIRWSEAVLGNVPHSPLWTAYVKGGVISEHPTKELAVKKALGSRGVKGPDGFGGEDYVAYVPAGSRAPVRLKANEHYVPPAAIPGVPVGQLMRESDVRALERLADEWIAASATRVGQLDQDASLHPLTRKIPAFSEILGFRGTGELDYDVLADRLLPEAQEAGDSVSVQKIRSLLCRSGRRAHKNSGRRLPIAGHALEPDPLLAGF